MWNGAPTQLTVSITVLAFTAAALSVRAARRELNTPFPSCLLASALACGLIAAPWILFGASWQGAFALTTLTVSCALIAEIDRRFMLIPDPLVIAVALSGVAGLLAQALGATPVEDPAPLLVHGVGRALAGAGALGVVFLCVRTWFAHAKRIEALGLGDVKLAAAMGAVLGVHDGFLAVAAAGVGMIAAMTLSRRANHLRPAVHVSGHTGSELRSEPGSHPGSHSGFESRSVGGLGFTAAASQSTRPHPAPRDAAPPGAAPFGIALTVALLAFAYAQFWATL